MQAECPRPAQFWTWIDLHEDNLWRLPAAIAHTAEKEDAMTNHNETMSAEHAVRYCSAYLNVLKTKDEEHGEENDNRN